MHNVPSALGLYLEVPISFIFAYYARILQEMLYNNWNNAVIIKTTYIGKGIWKYEQDAALSQGGPRDALYILTKSRSQGGMASQNARFSLG